MNQNWFLDQYDILQAFTSEFRRRFKKDLEININMEIPLFRDVSKADDILIRDAIDDKKSTKQLNSLAL